ncbi:hypothetical protein ILUMI_27053 [Ignelater luminosus]|uniref:PiggyBac transposable element-derived protein domain-containing protein n=1 Tax=Ignelater luminosus TaxID=2038154 RepID=A0A8K0C6Y3_IGNLU|nr:hypothetical protein ILUMI_27053 [Ignelater luminosus]
MDKKRPLTQNEIEYYANLSDSELDGIFGEDGNDSSDYEPSENSSDSEDEVVSEPEVDPESEDNDDDPQATTSNANDNLWTEIQQNPELFIVQENVGVKLDTTNFTVQTLVDLFFSDGFLALLVEQTNLYAAQEIEKRKAKKNLSAASSKIKLIKFKEEFVVALIGEEIQPVSKKIKLQELHYLESLPPTEKE